MPNQGDDLRKLTSGERLPAIPTGAWNSFIDAANDYKNRQRGQGAAPVPGAGLETGKIFVYNATGGGFGNTGIFLDDATSHLLVHHNLVYNADNALKMNPPANDNNLIYNNTLVGNKFSLGAGANADMTGSTFVNNIFTGKTVFGTGAIRHNNVALAVGSVGETVNVTAM